MTNNDRERETLAPPEDVPPDSERTGKHERIVGDPPTGLEHLEELRRIAEETLGHVKATSANTQKLTQQVADLESDISFFRKDLQSQRLHSEAEFRDVRVEFRGEVKTIKREIHGIKQEMARLLERLTRLEEDVTPPIGAEDEERPTPGSDGSAEAREAHDGRSDTPPAA